MRVSTERDPQWTQLHQGCGGFVQRMRGLGMSMWRASVVTTAIAMGALLVIPSAAWAAEPAVARASTPVTALTVATVRTPEAHRRGEEQTYLTFPEWYLVHSPAELADYLEAHRPPSGFPFLGHVAQFWQGYSEVTTATEHYPFNGGYHLMVSVIGLSTTVEYALRAVYEATIGHLTEMTATHGPTAEEQWAAKSVREYVDFIRARPWYEFDFLRRLDTLWHDVPWRGDDWLRKTERRFALSLEFGAKALYGKAIQMATQSVYDVAGSTTAVVLDREPVKDAALSEVHRLDDREDGILVSVPRYEGFMTYAQTLARQGLNFQEVAGNSGPILVSLLMPADAVRPTGSERLLFTQAILTRPGVERRVLTVPVTDLAARLRLWAKTPGVQVEHVYDY